MQPHTFVMRPVGSNQINPYFNPANPLMNYQLNLQVRQCAALRMNPPYNPRMMHPLNPFPPGHPGMINPQLMGPARVPPMIRMQNPRFPHLNGLPIPPMNCPPMPPRPNMPPVNLSQPIPNMNPRMMPPMNCQSFQSVNCQNMRPPMPHIPPGTPRPVPPPMSQPSQAGNPPNYPQNGPNVNYPNMPIPNHQNGPPVRGQMNPPMGNPQNCPPSQNPQNIPPSQNPQNIPPSHNPQNIPPSHNPQNIPPSQNPQNIPPSHNPQNIPPSHNPQNIPPSQNCQNFPSLLNPRNFPPLQNPHIPPPVNPQNRKAKPKTKPPPKKQNAKKPKEKKKKENGTIIFWEDPKYKKKKRATKYAKKKNESNALTSGIKKLKIGDVKEEGKKEGKKDEQKKVGTAKPNKGAPSNTSNVKNTQLITIKPKGDNALDEKKTQYFKNLRSVKPVPGKEHGKKKLSENEKAKAKILKVFSLMQKLKGVTKKLWQNVAANGEFKDNPGIREEVTKFCIFSHKFLIEVDCIVKLIKKEGPPTDKKAPKKDDANANANANANDNANADANPNPNPNPKDSQEASNNNSDQTTSTATKQTKRKQRKKSTIPFTVKLVLKKLNELDALGLCFVNINGIFVKRYCSVIIKLRKSLNALLDKAKTSLRKKRLKIPKLPSLPQGSAIMLTCNGSTSYEKALEMAYNNIKFKDLGIQCIKQRRSVTGGVILEVLADTDYEAKTDKLAEKLKAIYGSLEVRVTRPRKYGELVIKRLDKTATVQQICEQLAKLANCPANVFKTGSRGKTCIWVRCPLSIAIKLDQKTIKMDSTVARINLKAKKLIRCYKCFNMGHVKHLCPSLSDHNNLCFKCGQKDHEAKTCQNAPRCLTCYDNSLPTCHRLGGEKCPSAIPKIIKWPTKNVIVKKGGLKKKGKGSKGPKGKNMQKGKTIPNKSISCLPSAPDQVRSRN